MLLTVYVVGSKKLDETTAELKRTADALEEEKAKTDMLLYQMLPVKVADSLRDGYKVEAGEIHTHYLITCRFSLSWRCFLCQCY